MSVALERFGGVLPPTAATRWTCPTRETVITSVALSNPTATDATVTIQHNPATNQYDYFNNGTVAQSITVTVPAGQVVRPTIRFPMIYGGSLVDWSTVVGVTALYTGEHNTAWEFADLYAEISADLDGSEQTLLQHVPPPTVETRVPLIGGDVLNANGNSGLAILGPVDSDGNTAGPTVASTVAVVAAPGSALNPGIGHTWCVSWTFPSGVETLTGPLSSSATVAANQGAQITLPIGPAGTTKRSVYRLYDGERADYAALCGGTARAYAHWVADVPDNTTTTYTDTTADAVVANGHYPVVGTTTDTSGNQVPTGVDLEVRSFKAIGFTEACMSAQFPLMSPLSVNNTPNAMYDDRYLAFYKKVCDMIRAAGLHAIIECNTMFGGAYGPTPDWSNATWASFIAKKGASVQSIITYCQPEWTNLLAEPSTLASIIHFTDIPSNVLTFTNVKDYINACVPTGFNKGITKVGSGNFPNFPTSVAWNTSLLSLPAIDGIDLHTFDLDPATMTNIVAIAQAAHAAGKEIWSTETGLVIRRAVEARFITSQGSVVVYRRDCYADLFDLQVRFAQLMVELGRRCGLSFTNFFWTNLMFAGQPGTVWDPAGNPSDRVWYHGTVNDGTNVVPGWSIPYATSAKMVRQISTAGRTNPDAPTLNNFGQVLSDLAQQ